MDIHAFFVEHQNRIFLLGLGGELVTEVQNGRSLLTFLKYKSVALKLKNL